MNSGLPAPSRLLVFTLLTHVTRDTLMVPAAYSPSLSSLAAKTGLSRAAVANHLNLLEREGWLRRRRPAVTKARSEKARTGYQIAIPTSPGDGLVQEVDQSAASPGGGPADEEALFRVSPGDGLVQEVDGASPGGRHNPKYCPTSSSPSEKKGGAGGKHRPASTRANGEHPRFAEWYAAYPLHKAPGAAAKAFNKAVKQVDDIEILFSAVKRYRETDPNVARGYIAYPATWLNQKRWLDEPVNPDQPSAATGTDDRRPTRQGALSDVNNRDWSGWTTNGPHGGTRP
jgi:DNA-binding Lrp family transcriptional regulator